MSAENTYKRVLLRSLPGFGIRSRRISGPIRCPAAKASRSRGFPWRLSNVVIQMFRCSVFSALADKSHGAACRYAQIHYAGHCRQQPYERLAVEIDDIRIHGSRVHFKNRIRCESQRRTHEEQYPNDGQPQDGYCSAFPMLFFENIKRVQEATAINAPAQYNSPGNSLRMIPSLLQLQVIWLIDVLDGSRLYGVLRLPYLTWQSNCSFIIFEAVG